MIISASRRTDIPAFFGEWFIRRLREKKVLVRNPMNPHQVTEIPLDPEYIECIVFWSKNPKNFIPRLDEIDALGYKYYFQFTLTPYDDSLERGLGNKSNIMDTFKELSEKIGKEKVIWRYDPIILADYHARSFEKLCENLHAYTEKCVISFIDKYSFLEKDFTAMNIRELNYEECDLLAQKICAVAEKYGLPLASCCEKIDIGKYNIAHNRCIDNELINRICKTDIKYKKDPGQRRECGCIVSRDIGAYNTCRYNCLYCYAKRGNQRIDYDPSSPFLCDHADETDTINILGK